MNLKLNLIFTTTFLTLMNLSLLRLAAEETSSGFAVVELFTSEGCSSCPSADTVLLQLQEKANSGTQIYCLGHHVDYWDRLGWKDTYTSKEATKRQNIYANIFETQSIYTPQMIVNGEVEFVGSNKKKAEQYVEAALTKQPTAKLTINQPKNASGELSISGTLSAEHSDHSVYAFLVQASGTNQIMRGENSGRKLNHVSIVRDQGHVTPKNKEYTGIRLKLPEDVPLDSLSVIAILQHEKTGKINAANKVSLK